MALENALIAKIAGGLIAVGGASGGIYACKDNIGQWLNNLSFAELKAPENSYLVGEVVTTAKTTTTEELKTGNQKNYYCQIKDETSKIDCEITLIDFDATKKSIKLTDLKNKTSHSTSASTSPLTDVTNKYFKLKINSDQLDKFSSSLEKTIDLVQKDGNKKYGVFTSTFRVDSGIAKSKNNLLVAVASVVASTDSDASELAKYKCTGTIDSVAVPKTKCDVYKFATDVAENTEISAIDFSSNALTKLTDISTIAVENKLSIVLFTETNKIDPLTVKENQVFDFKPYDTDTETTPTASKKTYTFTVKGKLVGDIEAVKTKGIFIQDEEKTATAVSSDT